jgi:hypothetical protein
MAYAQVVFSETQQLGLLGHSISDAKIFEAARMFGVSGAWFVGVNTTKVWEALEKWYEDSSRHPTLAELKSQPVFVTEDQKIRDACLRTVDQALAAQFEIGYDGLVTMLREWSVARSMRETVEKTVDLWNRNDIELALKAFREGHLDLDRLDRQSTQARCQTAYERAQLEREERVAQKDKLLTYGITVLDEATGGILPNDLVLIGAKTGVGKTQAVTRIAAMNALKGKRVTLFALEAEEFEIERRIKFMLYGKAYREYVKQNKIENARALDYAEWRLGRMEGELERFEKGINAHMAAFSSLKTIYRKSGDYGIEELEGDILRLFNETDLFIVDHLHYIDNDDENENAGMKRIVKKLRDLALSLGKPIVLVAHLRKTQKGKYAPLVPDVEDFHGSSDIVKIATTAIILAPCYQAVFVDPDPELRRRYSRFFPTYIRLVKCRLEGSRLRFTSIAYFDPALGAYLDEYAIGRLVSNDCNWDALAPNEYRPHWAKSASIRLKSTSE